MNWKDTTRFKFVERRQHGAAIPGGGPNWLSLYEEIATGIIYRVREFDGAYEGKHKDNRAKYAGNWTKPEA